MILTVRSLIQRVDAISLLNIPLAINFKTSTSRFVSSLSLSFITSRSARLELSNTVKLGSINVSPLYTSKIAFSMFPNLNLLKRNRHIRHPMPQSDNLHPYES